MSIAGFEIQCIAQFTQFSLHYCTVKINTNIVGYGGNNNNYKKKSKTKSNLKKAAVIGATAYGAYQLGKLSNSFGGYHGGYHGGNRWGYRDWNNWREVDGFMCRNTNDCNWIDQRLYCQDYELKFRPSVSLNQFLVYS